MFIKEFIEPYPMTTKFLLNGSSVSSENVNNSIVILCILFNLLGIILSTGIRSYYDVYIIS
jgi:hypothetical protein